MQVFDWYTWVILPLIVFPSRVIDVGLGTMRIIFISRGKNYWLPCSALWKCSSGSRLFRRSWEARKIS